VTDFKNPPDMRTLYNTINGRCSAIFLMMPEPDLSG
jgi:hypothetical protein